jgi:predicted pyridoxine 5'-phosphate oxidase superfamily flavin-nucleotide-binding protein
MMDADRDPSPWHWGEREVHRRLGISEEIEAIGGHNIRPFMPGQHRLFFAQLPFMLVGSVDRTGRPWASLLSGWPGFVQSPDPRLLHVAALPAPGDPLVEALVPGGRVGMLGIELPTRRRNRVNGRIVAVDDKGFTLAIEQSFGNCPQYIRSRHYAGLSPGCGRIEPFEGLPAAARDLIGKAETAFVASSTPLQDGLAGSADVSHRGGKPGFVGITDDGGLIIPDYRGNRYFNTLGNLLINPRAGLLFIDFAAGDLLQITGLAKIVWDGPEVAAFVGAQRLWWLRPTAGQWLRDAFPLRVEGGEASPATAGTSTWAEVQISMRDPAVKRLPIDVL